MYLQRKWISKNAGGGQPRGRILNSNKLARLSFHCKTRNWGKGAPQAAHTDAPCNFFKLPSSGISSAVFLRMRPWHHQQNGKKTASRNKMSIKFFIPQWTVNNVRTNNMVKQCQKKRAACFLMVSYSNKNMPHAFSGTVSPCCLFSHCWLSIVE